MEYKIFWCKVNKYYVNQWLNHFDSEFSDNEHTLLVATCVVTDRAKNKRLKDVKKTLQDGKEVYITWCGTLERGQVISDSVFYSVYPELKKYQSEIHILGEAPLSEQWQVTSDQWKKNIYTKKFVVIQNGCDNYCTFCLTVKKRGKHRSRPLEEIVDEIKQFEQSWGKEIVITWINLAAWWCSDSKKPEESKFPFLLQEILKQTTIPRIRISSLWPEYLNDEFFDVIRDPRILPHFHLSIQSFSDHVLKLMKRNYSAEYLQNVLKKFPKHISVWADLIVGFPWESEEDFQETLHGVREFNITKVHGFPFSEHAKGETVPASVFEWQIARGIKIQRNKRLLQIADEMRNEFVKKNIGKKHKVLIENFKDGVWRWRTENYIHVWLKGEFKRWDIVDVVLVKNMILKDSWES